MIRPVLSEIAIFLIPFVIYAAFLFATNANVMVQTSWPWKTVGWLAVAALTLVFLSLVLLANFSGASPGSTYTPAHMENGKLVPGVEK